MRPRVFIQDESTSGMPIFFVLSEGQGNVHVFVPDSFHRSLLEMIARNFSQKLQQPVSITHDAYRQKFRICPLLPGSIANQANYGTPVFTCDSTVQTAFPNQSSGSKHGQTHIPRPRNSWILYRQSKSRELRKDHPGITASELSTLISSLWKKEPEEEKLIWQERAQEEDRLHKQKYPGYKYTTKKHVEKNK